VQSDRFADLRRVLGLQDIPEELLEQAFRHTSYVREQGLLDLSSNQRLEFLGDAVLDIIFADYLFRTRPELTEGQLTRLKAELVRQSALAVVAEELGLGEYLLLGKGEDSTGGRSKPSLLADTVEALIGVTFLADGLDAARELVLCHFSGLLDEAQRRDTLRDSKSHLQELLQANGDDPPEYLVTRTEGPPHDRLFHVEARVDGRVIGRGAGSSKRDAEQEAAQVALECADEWLPL